MHAGPVTGAQSQINLDIQSLRSIDGVISTLLGELSKKNETLFKNENENKALHSKWDAKRLEIKKDVRGLSDRITANEQHDASSDAERESL